MYIGKSIFLCEPTSSVALIFHHNLQVHGKRSLVPEVISPEPVDGFLNIKRRFEIEKILHKLYRIAF